MNTDISFTSDESGDENEDDRIKRENLLISLRKRRRPTTSDEWETIRHYITDIDGSSHSSPKIRSRDSLSNVTKKLSQITGNDKSSTNGEKEIVDADEVVEDDEEIIDDEVASNDRNAADDSNESTSIRSNINEKSFVWTTNEAVPKNTGQQNNAELKCIENESSVDDIRVENKDSHNKSPTGIDGAVQLTTVKNTHEEVAGCEQSTNSNDVCLVRTNNDQPTGAAQDKQKSQMTQTTLSSFNRLQCEVSEDSEGVNFHTDLPFGCLLVYDSSKSRVPSQIIFSSLDENVRKLKENY